MAERREHFQVEGERYVFRKPYERPKKSKLFRVRRRDKRTGEVKQITLLSENLTEAKQEVMELSKKTEEALKEAETKPEDRSIVQISVGDALDKWGTTFEVRPISLRVYLNLVGMYKILLGSTKSVFEITLDDIERAFLGWKDSISARTKISHVRMLRRFLQWCVNHNYIRENPVKKYEIPSKWRKEARKARLEKGQALSFDEARRLLQISKQAFEIKIHNNENRKKKAKPPEYLYMFILIGLRTGLRCSNIADLRWGDIDFDKRDLFLAASRMKNDLDFHVPIHDELVVELNNVLRSRKRIPKKTEKLFKVKRLKSSFSTALKRAELGDREFRVHDLRHTFATWLGEHCTHIVMQCLLGHASQSMTDHYARHQGMEVLRKGLNCLPWLSGQKIEKQTIEQEVHVTILEE